MTQAQRVIIIGAGILGLASAYHLLKGHAGIDLLVVERLSGPGQGDTARSAAPDYVRLFMEMKTVAEKL